MDLSNVKLGKGPAENDPRTLKISNYTTSSLPDPPPSVNNGRGITQWQSLLNDQLGDCAIAAPYHAVQTWRLSLTPNLITVPDGDVLRTYSNWTGYNPADPATDRGAVELDVLRRWRKSTLWLNNVGHNLKAFVDPKIQNLTEIKQSVLLFGGLYIGLQMPIAWQSASIWDDVTGPDGYEGSWGGHAVWVLGYDENFLYLVTWGYVQRLTWRGFLRYCDEAHTLMSDTDWMPPNGIRYDKLFGDLAAVSQ